MKKRLFFLFLVAAILSPVLAEEKPAHLAQIVAPPVHTETHNTVQCVKVTEEEITALFDRWNASLATLDPAQVAAQYAHDGVLLPTVSNQPRTNHAEIQDYFTHFLEKKPQGKIDFRIISLGCNTASDTGLYTFTLHDKHGKIKHVSGRYSFVYEYDDDQWLIEHHHSSILPEKVKHAKK